jgi:integrase
MSVKKVNGKYRLDIRPDGVKGKRIIKLFSSKSEALQYQNKLLSGRFETQAVQALGENLRLDDLIEKWYDLHGRSLKSSIDTKNRLLKLSENLKNPLGRAMDPESLAVYRKKRLESGVSAATLNRELITLKSMYRELKRLSVIDYDSSILKVRKLRETKIELTYLTIQQVSEVRRQSWLSRNDSLPYVVLICLVTGARWSEAEGLTVNNCINQGFQFVDTKNGQSRYVPVDKFIFKLIRARLSKSPFFFLLFCFPLCIC